MWEQLKSLYVLKYPFDEAARRRGVVERNVVGNRFEIAQGWFGPYQASHFFILRLASA
jgi:hypothetical protein